MKRKDHKLSGMSIVSLGYKILYINLYYKLLFLFLFICVNMLHIYLPSRIFCSIGPAVEPQRSQRYRSKYLVDSVFPAPDSPDTIMLWDCFNTFMSLNALSPARKRKWQLQYCRHLVERELTVGKYGGRVTYRWRRRGAAFRPETFPDKS